MDFWSRVSRMGPDECWEWQGGLNHDGYGVFTEAGKEVKAHRRAYELANGELPPYDPATVSSVRHFKCHNKKCCNPAHLKLGTHKENMQDSQDASLHQAGERHGRSVLTAERVEGIRFLKDCGVSNRLTAKIFKLRSPGHVSDIYHRRKWA